MSILTKLGIGLGLVAIAGIALWLLVNNLQESAEQAGAATAVGKAAQTHLKEAEKANEARNDLGNRTDEQRHADCVRDARNPEDC